MGGEGIKPYTYRTLANDSTGLLDVWGKIPKADVMGYSFWEKIMCRHFTMAVSRKG